MNIPDSEFWNIKKQLSEINKKLDSFVSTPQDDDEIYKMFIKYMGRNPKEPEYDTIKILVDRFGIKNINKSLHEASKRNIRSVGYFESQLDNQGRLIPHPNTKPEGKTIQQVL